MGFKEKRKMFLPCNMGQTEVYVYTDKDGKEVAFLTFEGAFCGKPKKRVAKKNGWELEIFTHPASFVATKETTIPISEIETFDFEEAMDEFLNEVEDSMGLVSDDGCGACTSSGFSVGYDVSARED